MSGVVRSLWAMFDVQELAAEMAEVMGRARSLDPEIAYSNQQKLADVRTLELVRRHVDGAEMTLLADLDVNGTTDIVTGHRTGNWLTKVAELSPAAARSRVKLGRRLAVELPAVLVAMGEGRICADRARLILDAMNDRVASQFRQMQAPLIEKSHTMTYDAFKAHLAALVYLLDPDGPEPADDVNNNRCNLTKDSGEVKLTALFVGDHAAVVEAAINQMTDELWRRHQADHDATNGAIEIPPMSTLRALAVAELIRRGLMVDETGTAATKPRTEATLVFQADETGTVYLNGDPLLRRRTNATTLACDIELAAIILDSLGVPLDMGRELRNANRAQKRALKFRDGGCVFPGCGVRPEHCDAHHVAEWWRDLGTTDVKHMVYLCRHHHGVIHRKDWSIQIGDDGWCWITLPSGISMWCQRHGKLRDGQLPRAA